MISHEPGKKIHFHVPPLSNRVTAMASMNPRGDQQGELTQRRSLLGYPLQIQPVRLFNRSVFTRNRWNRCSSGPALLLGHVSLRFRLAGARSIVNRDRDIRGDPLSFISAHIFRMARSVDGIKVLGIKGLSMKRVLESRVRKVHVLRMLQDHFVPKIFAFSRFLVPSLISKCWSLNSQNLTEFCIVLCFSDFII